MDVITAEDQDVLIVENGTERWIKEDLTFMFVPHTLKELESILGFMKVHIKGFSDDARYVAVYNKLHNAVQEE